MVAMRLYLDHDNIETLHFLNAIKHILIQIKNIQTLL